LAIFRVRWRAHRNLLPRLSGHWAPGRGLQIRLPVPLRFLLLPRILRLPLDLVRLLDLVRQTSDGTVDGKINGNAGINQMLYVLEESDFS